MFSSQLMFVLKVTSSSILSFNELHLMLKLKFLSEDYITE